MFFRLALTATLAGLIAVPALADDPASASPDKPVKEKKICRVETGDTGSIMPIRKCHTKEEWQAIDQQNSGTGDEVSGVRHGRLVGSAK